jgi:hypothetical protein
MKSMYSFKGLIFIDLLISFIIIFPILTQTSLFYFQICYTTIRKIIGPL